MYDAERPEGGSSFYVCVCVCVVCVCVCLSDVCVLCLGVINMSAC